MVEWSARRTRNPAVDGRVPLQPLAEIVSQSSRVQLARTCIYGISIDVSDYVNYAVYKKAMHRFNKRTYILCNTCPRLYRILPRTSGILTLARQSLAGASVPFHQRQNKMEGRFSYRRVSCKRNTSNTSP